MSSLSPARQVFHSMVQACRAAHLPTMSGVNEAATPMKPAPTAMTKALARHAPLRPQRSMIMFAPRLPTKPPTVYTEVRAEKVATSMGMHVGRP